MKRLTTHEEEDYNQPGCNDCTDYCWRCCKESGEIDECIKRLTWIRLLEIEDILGEDYGLDRLRALVQADREGRCIIAPVKPGEIAWGGHARFDPVLGETKNVIYPVILKGWWTGLKDYEYEPREFRFGDLYESYDAAEKALEGGKHG